MKAIRMNVGTKNELKLLSAYEGQGQVGTVLRHGFDTLYGDKITELPETMVASIDKMYYGYGRDRTKFTKVWSGEISFSAPNLSKWRAFHFNVNFLTEYRDRETGDFVAKDYASYGVSRDIFEKHFGIKLDPQELWDAGIKPYMAVMVKHFELENHYNSQTPMKLFKLAQWMKVNNLFKDQGSGLFSKRNYPTSSQHIVIREPSVDSGGNAYKRGLNSDYGSVAFMPIKFDRAHITMLTQLQELMQQVCNASHGMRNGSRRNQTDLNSLKSYEMCLKQSQDAYDNIKQTLLDRGHDTIEEAIEAENKMVAEVQEYLKNIPHADAVTLIRTPEVNHSELLSYKLKRTQTQIDDYTRYIKNTKQAIAGYDDELVTLEFKVAKRKVARFLITNGIKSTDDGGEEE
jgi:hypothetical protein